MGTFSKASEEEFKKSFLYTFFYIIFHIVKLISLFSVDLFIKIPIINSCLN